MTQLTNDQYEFLIRGIDAENRVSTKQNQSHVEAWDVRRHLIRAFGFGGFDIETIRCELIREIQVKLDKQGKPVPEHTPRWTVVYRADVRLTIKAVDGSPLARYEDGATGDAINMPSIGDAHDFAMKTALSQALKRCAVNLGDQFGLALYNGGKPAAVVLGSLVRPSATAADKPAPALPADDAPVQPEPTPAPAAIEEPSSTPAVEVPPVVEQAAPAKGPAALGAAASSLLDDIATANDQPVLRTVWKNIAARLKNGEVTKAEADYLGAQWKVRKEHLFPARPATQTQHRHIFALCKDAVLDDRDTRLLFISDLIGREIDTQNRLSVDEAQKVIDRLQELARQNTPQGDQRELVRA